MNPKQATFWSPEQLLVTGEVVLPAASQVLERYLQDVQKFLCGAHFVAGLAKLYIPVLDVLVSVAGYVKTDCSTHGAFYAVDTEDNRGGVKTARAWK